MRRAFEEGMVPPAQHTNQCFSFTMLVARVVVGVNGWPLLTCTRRSSDMCYTCATTSVGKLPLEEMSGGKVQARQ